MCHLIAYSQAAKAASVSRLLPIIDEMLGDCDPTRVAQLDPGQLRADYWHRLGGLRYPTKLDSMVGCAQALLRVRRTFDSFESLLRAHGLPLRVGTEADIGRFWQAFRRVQRALADADMPFFKGFTSLCHLLKDLGYPCLKPDSGVMKAAVNLGIVENRRYYPDTLRQHVVTTFQQCSLVLDISMAELDLSLLIAGGMSWAKQFVRGEYYEELVTTSSAPNVELPARKGHGPMRKPDEGRSVRVQLSDGSTIDALVVAYDAETLTVIPHRPPNVVPFRVPQSARGEWWSIIPWNQRPDSWFLRELRQVSNAVLGQRLAKRIELCFAGPGTSKAKWETIAGFFFGKNYHHHFHPPLMSGPDLIRIDTGDDGGYLLSPAGLRVPAVEN
jgi:hypothetical protein